MCFLYQCFSDSTQIKRSPDYTCTVGGDLHHGLLACFITSLSERERHKGEMLSVSAFSTCFLSAEKVINCFAGHLSDILERFNQIPLEHQDFRKVFDHP